MPEDTVYDAACPSQMASPRDSTPRASISPLPAPSATDKSYGDRGDMYKGEDGSVNPSNTPVAPNPNP